MADTFLCKRLTAVENEIVAYEDAILKLADGVLSYHIDTGQTNQRVTRQDLSQLRNMIDGLYNRRDILRVRCGLDSGQHTGQQGG